MSTPSAAGDNRVVPSTAQSGPNGHAYPRDLARLVIQQWPRAFEAADAGVPVPDDTALADVLSICYQATLLREEDRPVTFRLALSPPDAFTATDRPPPGLHRLVLSRSVPLDPHELRRLSPAVVFSRSLIGAVFGTDRTPAIWGVIHSGPRWLQSVRGGREIEPWIPTVPIVAATGPGRLQVSVGATALAELSNGTLSTTDLDVFRSAWMRERLANVNAALDEQDVRPALGAETRTFVAILADHVLRRVLATIRGAQHGGTLIILPRAQARRVMADRRYIQVKYPFNAEEPRRRILTLIATITDALAANGGGSGWNAYEKSGSIAIRGLDEALFEVAHLIADLSRVDGAVILSDSLEILGFGGEIAGEPSEIPRVAEALDLEGDDLRWVRTDRVGTRHRSAYRLCHALHDALVLVVSQDGGLRFVRWHRDRVAFWKQVATGPWEG